MLTDLLSSCVVMCCFAHVDTISTDVASGTNTAKIKSVHDSHSLSYFCDEFKGINYA